MVITVKQMATIKRVAQNVAPYTTKKAKRQEQLVKIATEIQDLDAQMEAFQSPIRVMTGGYTTEDILVRRVVNGIAKYEPNPDLLTFNEVTRTYEFKSNDEVPSNDAPSLSELEEEELIQQRVEENAAALEEADKNPFEE